MPEPHLEVGMERLWKAEGGRELGGRGDVDGDMERMRMVVRCGVRGGSRGLEVRMEISEEHI